MKIVLCILVALLSALPVQAEMGSFIILKSAYFYADKDANGPKILTRSREAYPVLGLEVINKEKTMFQILVPSKRVTTGSGFIVESDQELEEKKGGLVKVYVEMPDSGSDLTHYQLVPSVGLLTTGQTEKARGFPHLNFRAVNFKAQLPKPYWVDEWAGVYRPDKDADWLNRTNEELIRQNFSAKLTDKIIQGQVETGFNELQVKLALGEPVKTETLETGAIQWAYQDKKVIFEQGKVVRIL